MWSYNYSDELYHHGIKGQRWGIRRYQNKDGTLTPAGKKRALKMQNEYTKFSNDKRYRDKDGNLTYSGKKKALKMKEKYSELTGGKQLRKFSSSNSRSGHINSKLKSKSKDKSISEMTDDELKARTDRMIAEKNYLEAEKNLKAVTPEHVSLGKKLIKEYGPIVIKTVWNDVGKKYVENKLGIEGPKMTESQKLKQKAEDLENAKKIANAEDFFKKRSERKKEESKTETYSGTVEGNGTSSKKQSETRSQRRDTGPIDVDWRDVTDDSYNYGKSYVNQFLLEDKNKRK